jgi:rhomboid protease GluP
MFAADSFFCFGSLLWRLVTYSEAKMSNVSATDSEAVTEQREDAAKAPTSDESQFAVALLSATPVAWVTPTIIFANVLVFVLLLASSSSLTPEVSVVLNWGANFGPRTLHGDWWRLVTSMFLHFGVIHLGLNMWALWDTGRLVERLVGNVGFVLLYLLCGVFGSLASLWWRPTVISAGASGAVFGVFGALLGLLIFRRDSIPPATLVQLRNSVVSCIGYNLVFGLTSQRIDNAAHIGGLLAGVCCGVLLNQPFHGDLFARRIVRNCCFRPQAELHWRFRRFYCHRPRQTCEKS